jgi:putative ATPase
VHSLLDRGLELLGADADDDALAHLAATADGDARHGLGALEVASALAEGRVGAGERPRISLQDAEDALGTKALGYGVDQHYDVASALIKSIRGSDPDAGLYWLAHMLEAGEDARFIARRLVILASEDVGMADPMGLVVADAAARAVEFVGLPEAQLNLAHAVVYLASAPKSNRVTVALGAARQDVRATPTSGVPMHLRGTGYRGAEKLGHGTGYRYPHDDPAGWVAQQYRPAEVSDHRYYEPSAHGLEGRLGDRWPPVASPVGHDVDDVDGDPAEAGVEADDDTDVEIEAGADRPTVSRPVQRAAR